jgi:hypothetical protein
MLRPSRLLAGAALALALAGPTAVVHVQAAEPFSILYTGHGQRDPGVPGKFVGKADDWAGLSSPIPGDWDVVRFETHDLPAQTFFGTTIWTDTGPGGNNLFATFTGGWELVGDDQHVRVFNNFVITGGTGIFAGATGTGEDRVYTNFVAGQYVESGMLTITPVPEPGTALLLITGAMALTAMRRRQRR